LSKNPEDQQACLKPRTMEWLSNGQHIEKYSIDVWTGNTWKSVGEAQAVGHEKVELFSMVSAGKVRLNILSSTGATGPAGSADSDSLLFLPGLSSQPWNLDSGSEDSKGS
jgi:hypothetical protein